jgi:hypothetical protein
MHILPLDHQILCQITRDSLKGHLSPYDLFKHIWYYQCPVVKIKASKEKLGKSLSKTLFDRDA